MITISRNGDSARSIGTITVKAADCYGDMYGLIIPYVSVNIISTARMWHRRRVKSMHMTVTLRYLTLRQFCRAWRNISYIAFINAIRSGFILCDRQLIGSGLVYENS